MSHAGEQPLLECRGVVKRYGAPRPLRVEALVVHAGERVALLGLDAPAAEMFVALVLGAALPDEGEIRLFGRPTVAVRTQTEWFAALDRVGLVSPRAALLEMFSVAQNLALPWTLDIDPLAPETAARAATLAAEVGIAAEIAARRVGDVGPEVRLRVHLGRALALDPTLLLLEHPTAQVSPREAEAFGREVARLARHRGVGLLALTADDAFARTVAERRLILDAASGRVKAR